MSIRPFAIHVPDAVLHDLQRRLEHTRWPGQVDGAGWDYGAELAYVRRLCDHWAHGFDWRAQEHRLNELPGFLCEVDGVDIHFWHVRSGRKTALPLLLVHGWPGSIVEFRDLVEPLADAGFDVVVAALPGYGFGGIPCDRGWGPARIADAFDTLMTRALGYPRYGIQGGDWGAIVGGTAAFRHPETVAALHLNMPYATDLPGLVVDPDEAARHAAFRAEESGYSHQQSTRPDSLTLAQNDSPAGLAAWVVEKFRRWSDCGGDVERSFPRETLLTNLMFYWATGAAPSSARLYYERQHQAEKVTGRVTVPTAVAAFPAEPFGRPREVVEQCFTVVRWTDMPRGGHFAALEEPQLLLDDVTAFFDEIF